MSRLSCIVIDDEPGAHLVMRNYIDRVPFLESIGYFFDAVQARTFLLENNVDVIFVDINMPEFDGLSLLRSLPERQKAIITSAYSEYAIDGFELEVIDYLLKPFRFERFLRSLHKLEKGKEEKKQVPEELNFRVNGENRSVKIAEIRLIQSKGNYLRIQTDRSSLVVHGTTSDMEAQLKGTCVIRIHKSYLVNILEAKWMDGEVLISEKWKVPVGKTYKKYLLSRMESK